jgi:hypothetical protein
MPAKYDTLAQLRDGYDRGEIPRSSALILDGDNTYVYVSDSDSDYDDINSVFQLHPSDLLMQALDLLGIPYEGT